MTDTYDIHYTNKNITPISILEQERDTSTLDIPLFGRLDIEYGALLDQTFLHLLESFACPELSHDDTTAIPDTAQSNGILSKPIKGQLWYNKTTKKIYHYNGTSWILLLTGGMVSANWGQVADGDSLPKPINQFTGYEYDYTECIWAVSPIGIDSSFTYMLCTTDQNAVVNMKYRLIGTDTLISGVANYLIIGIEGTSTLSNNLITVPPVDPLPVTPTPQPTPPVTQTPEVTPTSTPEPSPPNTPAVTETQAPTQTPAPTPPPTPTPPSTPPSTPPHTPPSTPPPSPPPRTPPNTPTPAPTSSPAPTSTPAPTQTPVPTRTPTPAVTPSAAASPCPSCTNSGVSCCVSIHSILPFGGVAGSIRPGDIMLLADQGDLSPGTGIVSYSKESLQPCVRIMSKSGVSLVCSTTAPIPTMLNGLIKAPELLGKMIAIMTDGEAQWDECVMVEHIGDQLVQNITVGDKCFWAGEQEDKFILHHNLKFCGGSQDCIWVGPNCCDCR